jgi:2-dehydro-3-deoxyphosphogluconate aldolase/(4S)-4-hydroxy-2-oxoglutarate aldolase
VLDHVAQQFGARQFACVEVPPLGQAFARLGLVAGVERVADVGEEVAELADKKDLTWVPGCLTPTEIIRAESLGAGLVKLFPGSLTGPSYLAAMKEVFPGLLFMPTGGVETNEENLKSWFISGASAVGLGSKLISKNLMDNKDYQWTESLTRQTLQIVQLIKSH